MGVRCFVSAGRRAGPVPPPTPPAPREITNNEFSLFAQDSWQIRPNLTLNYGLRWDAQTMPETVDPRTTAYGAFLNDPTFPSDGTIPSQWSMWQPRLGVAWDVKGDGTSLVRASWGVYYARQNMLSQVGSVTTNGLQQQTIFANNANLLALGVPAPVWPDVVSPTSLPEGQFPFFSGVRVFDGTTRTRTSSPSTSPSSSSSRRSGRAMSDFIWNEGQRPDAIPELQPQRPGVLRRGSGDRQCLSSTTGIPGVHSSAR